MPEKELPILRNIQEFLFEAPLYERFSVSVDTQKAFYSPNSYKNQPIDGHCPYCNRASTFNVRRIHVAYTHHRENPTERECNNEELVVTCVRSDEHELRYFFRKLGPTIEKIGQFPSLADIANDEVVQYRPTMEREDAHEFHKAIGLAAHGVGVGSFVYLRRVFERLIYSRFREFQEAEGWTDDQFYAVRMEDKVKLLKGHLPAFLVENRKIYSILSVGVHELDEKTCLNWFEAMKQSILIILEDDKKKKEELQRRQVFSDAIAGFENKSD